MIEIYFIKTINFRNFVIKTVKQVRWCTQSWKKLSDINDKVLIAFIWHRRIGVVKPLRLMVALLKWHEIVLEALRLIHEIKQQSCILLKLVYLPEIDFEIFKLICRCDFNFRMQFKIRQHSIFWQTILFLISSLISSKHERLKWLTSRQSFSYIHLVS